MVTTFRDNVARRGLAGIAVANDRVGQGGVLNEMAARRSFYHAISRFGPQIVGKIGQRFSIKDLPQPQERGRYK